MKRYAWLFVSALAIAAAVLVLDRFAAPRARPEERAPGPPTVLLEITVTPDGRIDPSDASVPKGHLVRLAVRNETAAPVSLTLMGYQDRVAPTAVPPDSVWYGEFLADRPGDDFAWMLAGSPAGRLAVSGSHLEEGHR